MVCGIWFKILVDFYVGRLVFEGLWIVDFACYFLLIRCRVYCLFPYGVLM